MKRKRDGFVPLGDVANMVELPDGCPPRAPPLRRGRVHSPGSTR